MCGTIDVLDVRFGSLWTNIPRTLFLQTGIQYGDRVSITIENDTRCVYRNIILFARSFADVYVGEALAYVNSCHQSGQLCPGLQHRHRQLLANPN